MFTQKDAIDINNAILDAITIYQKATTNAVPCDKTFEAKIIKKRPTGKYLVLLNGKKYDNIPSVSGFEYLPNEKVELRANQGNMDWLKIITPKPTKGFFIAEDGSTVYIGKNIKDLILTSGTHKFYACNGEVTISNANVIVYLTDSPNLIINNTVGAKTYRDGYGVGDIHQSTNSTSPAVKYGGSWERFGNGRVLVGVDENDTDFLIGTSRGEKAHALTENENGEHTHVISGGVNESSSGTRLKYTTPTIEHYGSYANGMFSSGRGLPHNNLQPYTTVYIWRRIA